MGLLPLLSRRSCLSLPASVCAGQWQVRRDRVLSVEESGVMIMHRNQSQDRVRRRLAACAAAARPLVAAGAAGILAAAMLTAAVLAGAAPAGAAAAPHKPAAAASSNAAAVSLPPIRSANGKIAPPAAGSGGWHVARARSGHGQSSAAGLHR